jgi:phosphatidylglycerophosphate synthase
VLLPCAEPRSLQAQTLHALRLDAAREALAAAALLVAGVAIVVALGWMAHAFALKAVAVFALACVLLLWGLAGHMPHRRFGAANRVTLLRLAMIAMLAGALGEANPDGVAWAAVVLATVAALLDALDGPLARAQGLASEFGARFDMESDAFLVMVLSLLVWHFDKAGPWVLLAGLARYVFVAAACAWPWLSRPLPASMRRKTVCVVQITSLIVCLGPIITRPWSQAIAATSLGLLLFSFAADVLWLAQRKRLAPPSKDTE